MAGSVIIRQATETDKPQVLRVFRQVLVQGETWPHLPESSDEELLGYWFGKNIHTVVAVDPTGKVVGAYYLKPNIPGRASHIANGGYVVDETARGQGIGKSLGLHSIQEAARLGYQAIQYNLVVSTNKAAVTLWTSLGFKIAATIPQGFLHPTQGYVDTYIMFRPV